MEIVTSKLTKKYQATIPELIRKNLELEAGDSIAFEFTKGKVSLRKAQPIDIAFIQSLESTLTEWDSEADNEAYNDL